MIKNIFRYQARWSSFKSCLDQVASVAPELQMSDYRVTYSKHKQFKEGKGERGSIVRIFTNISLG